MTMTHLGTSPGRPRRTQRTLRDRKKTLGFGLVTVAALAALLLLPTLARAEPDPRLGRDLYLDTPNNSGVSSLNASCTNCHGTVQMIRAQRLGSTAWGNVTFDRAMTGIGRALQRVADMQQFRALSQEQLEHLGAYLADVPRTDLAALDLVASASGATADQTITLRHAVTAAAGETLRVQTLAISAHSPPRFTLAGGTCSAGSTTLNASGSCTIVVRYTGNPGDSAAAPGTATLNVGLQVGTATTSRAVALSGSLAGATPPPSGGGGGGSSGDSGGGALGAGWLFALGLGALALARPRRGTGPRHRIDAG